MALNNKNYTKVGSSYSPPATSGQSQAAVVIPATVAVNPGANDGTSSWPQRYQQYIQSITPAVKYSQDFE